MTHDPHIRVFEGVMGRQVAAMLDVNDDGDLCLALRLWSPEIGGPMTLQIGMSCPNDEVRSVWEAGLRHTLAELTSERVEKILRSTPSAVLVMDLLEQGSPE